MSNAKIVEKKPYTTPNFERYGDVRELTQSLSTQTAHLDGTGGKAGPRTH